jgi:hypothetical protein
MKASIAGYDKRKKTAGSFRFLLLSKAYGAALPVG